MLKLDNGDICSDMGWIKGHAHDYFVKLFGPPELPLIPISYTQHMCPGLTHEDCELLTRLIHFWETTKAIHSMKPFKAPGPDRYQPLFFQKFWNLLGPSVHKLVRNAFATWEFDRDLNAMLLVLIPKTKRPESLKHFRPISLCNVIYKIITKVLVHCLK